jgi:hypothetical protein
MKQATSIKLPSLIKLSSIVSILLSSTAFSESYQSFSSIGYSNHNSTINLPLADYHSKRSTDNVSLFSQYFFEEQQSLGPLNEFDYINTSSNIYALVNNSNTKSSNSYKEDSFGFDESNNSIDIGGQWITHGFLLGAGYNYTKYKVSHENTSYDNISFDRNDDSYSASLGYFILDDLVIRADYFDAGDKYELLTDDDYFSYSVSYNLQLAGTDYIGFSYNVDDDFDIHQLSSRYFLSLTQESYLVLGGEYVFDNRDNFFAEDSWSINGSYYFNTQTSVSAFYGKDDTFDEADTYGIAVSYFINDNYSVQAGYNANNNDKYENDQEGYSLSFSAQF